MLLNIATLLGSLLIILLAAEVFTNSIEWAGHKLRLSEGIVGSVLAAVGTALPETMIPIIAVFLGGSAVHSEAVGVGAILGAPFMLATLAMFVTGCAALAFRKRRARGTALDVHTRVLGRDVRFFFVAYAAAIATAFIGLREVQIVVAIALLGLYGFYLFKHATEGGEVTVIDHLATPLHFHRSSPDPSISIVFLQLAAGLLLMMGGALYFVQATSALAEAAQVPALILSLIIAPIATELPEKFNSILWVRSGKDTLALGNITGAMMFQSCLPVTFGIIFTNWTIDAQGLDGFLSAFVALASTLTIFGTMILKGRLSAVILLTGGFWYALYIGYLLLR